MIRYLLAAVSLLFLVGAASPPRSDNGQIPSEIRKPSSVGEVIFQHQTHIKDRGIACVDCHHQINARKLDTPHPTYFKSSAINCKVCHDEAGKTKEIIYACSDCHGANPRNIADETLSAKVVIHQSCWKCHPVNTGKDASASCQKCHSGKKKL